MTATGCISTPISWPRLEAHVLAPDATVSAHVADCAACRACLDEIERDVVALPALPALPAPAKRRRWWVFGLVPALAAAAILVLVLRPRGEHADNTVAHIKGVGDVSLDLVRERAGVVTYGARTFAPGDRWKVVLTCPPEHFVIIGVEVRDGSHVDHPLAPAVSACGNQVVVPGAFTLDGGANDVCVNVGPTDRRDEHTACVTLRPE